jgi:hypothetical protein
MKENSVSLFDATDGLDQLVYRVLSTSRFEEEVLKIHSIGQK